MQDVEKQSGKSDFPVAPVTGLVGREQSFDLRKPRQESCISDWRLGGQSTLALTAKNSCPKEKAVSS